MGFDRFTESSPSSSRVPPHPEAEKPSDTTATAEEASTTALGNGSDDAASNQHGDGSVKRVETKSTTIDIVRATMALRLEPWRMLPQADRETHIKHKCAGAVGGCAACELVRALYQTQRDCAAIANLIARTCDRLDGAFWDDALTASNGERVQLPTKVIKTKKGAEKTVIAWPADDFNAYELGWLARPGVIRATVSALAAAVTAKWRQERWDILLKSDRSAARYRSETMPIPLRAADCRLVETDTRDVFALHFSLTAGRSARGKQFVLPIKAKDQRQYRDLHAIVTGVAKLGEIKIKRDRIGKHWEARIAYKRKVTRAVGDKLAAINRGITCILAYVIEGEHDRSGYVFDGHDIEQHLRATQIRRRRYQNTYRWSGRKGRGRKTALRPTFDIEGQTVRWRQTRIQTIARETARDMHKAGVSRVLIDDLKGIRDGAVEMLDGQKAVWDRIQTWPNFEMFSRLKACLEEYGIEVSERLCAFGSRDCPACGHRNEPQKIGRKFVCAACKHTDHVDLVLSRNLMLRERSGGSSPPAAENADDSRRPAKRRKGARKPRAK
jgi:transposase